MTFSKEGKHGPKRLPKIGQPVGHGFPARAGAGFGSSRQATARHFDVHPFVTGHPEAVFIQRTQIPSKTDAAAKKQAGLDLVRQVLFLRDDPGIPLSHKIAFKPNMKLNADLTLSNMSLGTDVSFSEGICEGLKELGLGSDQLYRIRS